MLKFKYWAIVLVIVMMSCQVPDEKKEVIGCYQSWKWQKFPELLNPQNIPYDKLTMINYSFFYPLENGEIVGMDPAADRYLLEGKTDSLSTEIDPGGSIIELANLMEPKLFYQLAGGKLLIIFRRYLPILKNAPILHTGVLNTFGNMVLMVLI